MASSALVLNATSDNMSSSLISSDLLIIDEMTPSDTTPNDLETLAYSIAMLIVEGRDSTKTLHATPSIDKLIGNMFNLSQQQTEKSAIKKTSKTLSSNHICDESTNQCRLASKIKKNIEKCVGHHHHHHGRLDQMEVGLEDVILSSSPTSSQLKRRLSNKLKHHHHHHHDQSVYVLRKRVDSNNNLRIESNEHTPSTVLIDNDESQETSVNCVTIQVYLVPECCHHHIRLENGDNLIDIDQQKFSGELLERWTITMISEKNNESTVNISKALLNINGLFQAIRSYLHFSQISSWINQSKGSEPKHLAFSVSYTSEKNSNSTIESRQIIEANSDQQSFEFHSFPTLSLVLLNNRFWISTSSTSNTSARINNSINLLRSNLIRVGLYSRKRNSFSETITNSIGIPLIPCSLGHQSSIESCDTQEVETGDMKSRSSLKPLTSPPLQQQFNRSRWSAIVTASGSNSPASGLLRDSSFESSANVNDNDLAVELLDEQDKFQSSSTTLTLITTPTSFNSSSLPSFLFKEDSSREKKTESSTPVKNFLISQSPKVLVSNHQLDLCTHATNNLKLDEPVDELAACAASKRKLKASFNQTSGSGVTHSKKFFTGEDDQDEQTMDVVARDEQSGDDDLVRKLNNNPSVNFKKIGEDDLIKTRLLPRRNYPLSSSPAPLRKSGSAFDFDTSLRNPKSIKNAFCLSKAIDNNNNAVEESINEENNKPKQQTVQLSYSNANFNSIQLTPNRLLGSFEESLLNGRMNPVGVVDGFYAEIGASGSFFPEHVTLPVHTAFYQVCEDVAASPYLGVLNLASLGKRGYKVPSKGTIQVTLFNPNNTVVKMFVVMYDLSDMPPGNKTFLRQRTMYVPLLSSTSSSTTNLPTTSGKVSQGGDAAEELLKSYLRYLIHLRFATSRSGKMYLHTNIKLIFARNKCEIDPRLAKYEYKTFTEAPRNPKYSPKK